MPRLQRWPEKLNVDGKKAGSRGEHGQAQLIATNPTVALALAGKARIDGEARTGTTRAAVNSAKMLPSKTCAMRWGKRVRGKRLGTGKPKSEKRAAETY